MPSLIEIADSLKGMPDDYLQQEAQQPSGVAPPYLVLAEIQRRQTMRQAGAGGQPPAGTVYEDLLRQPRELGVGLAAPGLPPQMTPQASIMPQASMTPQAQPERAMPAPPEGYGRLVGQGLGMLADRLPPMRMAAGGIVRRMQAGGFVPGYDPVTGLTTGNFGLDYPEPAMTFSATGTGIADRAAAPLRRRTAADCPPGHTWEPNREICIPPRPRYTAIPELMEYPTVAKPTFEQAQAEIAGKYPRLDLEPYQRRLETLESQREGLRGPRWHETMLEAGLGLMSSRSPYFGVAAGEAGLAATKSMQARQDQMRQERAQLEDKISGAELARETARHSGNVAEFDAASKMYDRLQTLYGIETQMTAAEFGARTRAQQERVNAINELAAKEDKDLLAREALLGRSYELSPEVIAAKASAAGAVKEAEWPYRKMEIELENQRYKDRQSYYRPPALPAWKPKVSADDIVMGQFEQMIQRADPKEKLDDILKRSKDRAVELLDKGAWADRWDPELRKYVRASAGAFQPNPAQRKALDLLWRERKRILLENLNTATDAVDLVSRSPLWRQAQPPRAPTAQDYVFGR